MKSKLMIFRNNFCLLLLLCFNLNESVPTFGNEFVHIKVHLPKECLEHAPPVNLYPHPIVQAPVTTTHKVIHHYHHRKRKPVKNNPFGKQSGLLENILLAEVKPTISGDHIKYLNHAENIAEHFDSFVSKPKPHVETYKVIEETETKPIEETYKIIESKVPQQQLHYYDSHDEDSEYEYKPKGHAATYKVIDDLFDDYHQHFQNVDTSYLPTKKQRLKSHQTDYEQQLSNYEEHDLEDENDAYHYGSKSHADTVEIVETKTPHEYSSNFGKRPYSETVEITSIKSNSKPFKSRYQLQQYSFDDHDYQYETPNSNSGFGIGSSHEDTYSADHGYKQQNYRESYKTIPEPEQSYLPHKHTESDLHHHYQYHKNMQQNSLYDDEPIPTMDSVLDSLNEPYMAQVLPQTLRGSQQFSGQSSISKPTETYSGIDSYRAPHVQGVSSNGYQYLSPYQG